MSRKGENIRKRKDGRWEGRYAKGRTETGKIIYNSLYGKTYKEVKEKLRTASQNQNDEIFHGSKDLKFYELLQLWENANRMHWKKGSQKRYSYLISTHIRPYLGEMKLSQLDAIKINTFLMDKLQKGRLDGQGGLAPSYVNSMSLIITAALKYATNENLYSYQNMKIRKAKEERKEIKIISINDQQKLEEFCFQTISPTNVGIMISLYTGLRLGEICALSWDHVDMEERIIHVRQNVVRIENDTQNAEFSKSLLVIDTPKTSSSIRDIPISETLYELLKKFRTKTKFKYLVSDKNSFLSPRTFEYRYHRSLKTCGIAPVNFHTLRHTFATRCIEAGIDPKTLSELLGHSNVSITLNTYVHSSMTMKRMQIEKLNKLNSIFKGSN